jgi:enoyl-CoA hydratase/carnithine racemase
MNPDMMKLQDVLYERVGTVAIATLNRPRVLNALREGSISELLAVVEHVHAAPGIRALVLTGAGRGFCSGEDLTELGDTLETQGGVDGLSERVARLQRLTRRLVDLPIPVIAAVNGPAVGLGAELALNCDLRIAADSATIGFPEVRRGLLVTNGGLYLLPRLVGQGRTMELLMGGERISAERAEQIGLVNEVVADEELLDHALRLAEGLAANAPISIEQVKSIVRVTWDATLDEVMDLEAEGALRCVTTGDAREGVAAYHDGRVAAFQGERE